MKKILFILGLFMAFAADSQPLNYTRISNRYRWVSGMFDSALYVPRYNGTPSGVRVGENSAIDGAIAIDTANSRAYMYSGGAWVRLANYAEVGGTYTASNGITLSGSNFKLGGTLVDATTTIDGDGKDLTITGLAALNIDGTEPFNFQVSSGGSTGVLTVDGGNSQLTSTRTGAMSIFKIDEDSIISKPHIGAYYIDSLNYTLTTTGKKIMLRDTATGLVQNIDPSLLTVSGITAGSQGQIYQTSNGAAAWKYDTTTLVTFTAGANFAADTAAFTDSTIYGSFKLMGNDTFYVTGVSVVLYSNNAITDTLGIQITYNDTINVIGSHVFAATYAVNNGTTGQDADGDDFTGSNSVAIPPNNWVWLKSPTVVAGRKPYMLSVSIIGYKKRVN